MTHLAALPRPFLALAAALAAGASASLSFAAPGFTADKSASGVVIKHDGQPFAEYVIGTANKAKIGRAHV